MKKITMRDENNNKNAIFAQKHQIWVKIGWIGCANKTSKRLPGFFFRFNILNFIYFLTIKPLRPKHAHFCHLIFQL